MVFRSKHSSILLTALLTAMGVLLFIRADKTYDDKMASEFEQYYRIYSLSIPDELVFAGEPVPLGDFDVKDAKTLAELQP